MSPRLPQPPKHLRPATRAWWRRVLEGYDLEPASLPVLQAAAEAWDRMQEARERIANDGAYLPGGRGQLRAHPALAAERDSRIGFLRALRELALPLGDPDSARPPRAGSGARS